MGSGTGNFLLSGEFKPISIKRIGEKDTLMIISQHKVPETGNVMKVYHLIFQLNDSLGGDIGVEEEQVIEYNKGKQKVCI